MGEFIEFVGIFLGEDGGFDAQVFPFDFVVAVECDLGFHVWCKMNYFR